MTTPPPRVRRRIAGIGLAVLATVAVAAMGSPAQAAPVTGAILNAGAADAVPGSYIVVLRDGTLTPAGVDAKARDLATRHKGAVARTYGSALRGFESRMSVADARALAGDPAVLYVEQNRYVHADATQANPPSWGLDRIDQRNLPLNSSYTYPNTGSGVKAYIVDTGIRRTHTDFGGRAIVGFDAVTAGGTADDCNGHGTHVSGTVGGSSYGVAKGVTLVAVRVLDCAGSGTNAGVIAGVDWVTSDHLAGQLAVANMSLGGGFNQALNDAVTRAITDGVSFAVAAGNSNANACSSSPSSTPAAITVGATDSADARASFSNFGTCLDIFAPGVNITSAWNTSNTATNTISGTSMASPHVAGAAALVVSANPSFTPAQVRNKLVADATAGVVTNPGTGSPNALLFVGNIAAPTQDFSVSVSPAAGATNAGGSLSATVATATTAGAAQTVSFSASGLPAGATASFAPASVTSGGSSTLTIATAASTPAGTFTVTITGTGSTGTHTAAYALTINGAPGCTQTNSTPVPIPDLSTINSTVTISGCAGNASATSTVAVNITHTWSGDLVVSLVAPDGSVYVLSNRLGGSTDNIVKTFTVNLSTVVRNGTWTLRVQDAAAADVGTLNTWTLTV